MHGRSIQIFLLALTLILLLTPLASAQVQEPTAVSRAETAGADLEHSREKVIQTAYMNLQSYARASGFLVTFTVSALQTFEESSFSSLHYGNLVSIPTGPALDTVRTANSNELTNRLIVKYSMHWVDTAPDFSVEEWLRWSRLPLKEFLAMASSDHPDAANVYAVTTFKVTAQLEGRELKYRGAFFWIRPNPSSTARDLNVIPVDPITQGVEQALVETVPVDGQVLDPNRQGRQHPDDGIYGTVCYDYSVTPPSPRHDVTDTTGHHTGFHESLYSPTFKCSCSYSCASTCDIDTSLTMCRDTGITFGFHVTQQTQTTTTTNRTDGYGATCAAGYICGVKRCVTPFCAFTVTVNFNGSTIQASAPGALWTDVPHVNNECPMCMQIPNYGPDSNTSMIMSWTSSTSPGGGYPSSDITVPPLPGGPGAGPCTLECHDEQFCTIPGNPATCTLTEVCNCSI
jgi:hypothetical protein